MYKIYWETNMQQLIELIFHHQYPGIHNYKLLNMHRIFYEVGVNIKDCIKIPIFENTYIYPFIYSLLDIFSYD